MSKRLRLQLAAGALAIVAVVAVVSWQRGGGGSTATGNGRFSLVVPPDERAAVRVLTTEAIARTPSLARLLLVFSLPVEPRIRRLEVPAPRLVCIGCTSRRLGWP